MELSSFHNRLVLMIGNRERPILPFPQILDNGLGVREPIWAVGPSVFIVPPPIPGMEDSSRIIHWRLIEEGIVFVELLPGKIDVYLEVLRIRVVFCGFSPLFEPFQEVFVCCCHIPDISIYRDATTLADTILGIPFKHKKSFFEIHKHLI